MKITQLTTENFKRIRAVDITPDGAMVLITGRNGSGKSSTLDSIACAIGGKDMAPARPVRDGEKKAKIVCRLDDLVVTRTFTADGGGTLTVANAEGARYTSPQAVLDKLVGKIGLDPLAFSRMDARRQLETLKAIVGLDFTAADAERKERYAERTNLNREYETAKAQAAALPRHADAPDEEVSVADLSAEFVRRQRVNEANAQLRRQVETVKSELLSHQQRQAAMGEQRKHLDGDHETALRELDADLERKIAQLKREHARAKELATTRHAANVREMNTRWESHAESIRIAEMKLADLRAKADKAADLDAAEIELQMAGAEATNRKVRENRRREELDERVEALADGVRTLTERIEQIDRGKREQLAAAAFPVPDLSFDETGVLYRGVPFAQASSAEQLRASVAIGLAMNPKLRVLLVRDGSLLDAEGMAALAAFAEAHDAQVWVERVSDGDRVGVVIEDGMVAEAGEPEPAAEGAGV